MKPKFKKTYDSFIITSHSIQYSIKCTVLGIAYIGALEIYLVSGYLIVWLFERLNVPTCAYSESSLLLTVVLAFCNHLFLETE
ncbi:hypothetical protein EDB19DRAFT_1660335 [Suillus lakei]|nr:hypothetical protein EDB19DRAFT_1660335 [Suillus lakei]